MANDLIAFGTWVRLRRQALVLTREELASRVGCAEVTIRKIEADERKPSSQVAELLAQQLSLPADQRELFVRVARGMVAVAQLPPPIPGVPTVTPSAGTLPIHHDASLIDTQQPPSSGLTTGTVTFLFTDIEGSTRHWEQYPEAMRQALARHDALLRQAIEAHHGHVFKTVGDSFCAAFASAPDALAAAIASQRTLLAEDWGTIGPIRVRMALHTGTAEPQAGDYLGQPLNRIARLLAVGHGGQILLSLATHELVRDHLPTGASVHDLGSHRLKDLVRLESVFQANDPDLPQAFPPLKSLNVRSTNLPAQINSLIGRTREVAEVIDLLDRARLVTLTGPGGTGKTRLVLQIGSELLDQYPDGIWFVDLSPVSASDQITVAIAQVLGVPESVDRSIRDGVLQWLGERQVLLILDNCEQVIAGAADLVAELLRGARQLAILATSRIPLRIAAEHEYAVAPLGLPKLGVLPPLDQLSQYDAVALFTTRARAVRADFAITNANAPAVAEICTRLDGLPLAIELAAARIRFFAPDQLLSRLVSARMQTLTGGARDLPARQQTIRATIAWSYRLLTPPQQTLLARLGVFIGGWTLEAADSVCTDPKLNSLEELEALVEQSLVRSLDTHGEVRYTMLETIREYALERLAERGESEQIQQRHAEYFTQLAEEAEPKLFSAAGHLIGQQLLTDLDNLRVAFGWAVHAQPDLAGRIVAPLFEFAKSQPPLKHEIPAWFSVALKHRMLMSPTVQAKVLTIGAAMLYDGQPDLQVAQWYEEGIAIYRQLKDVHGLALALAYYGSYFVLNGEDAHSEPFLQESLALAQLLELRRVEAWALYWIGWKDMDLGDADTALRSWQRTQMIYEQLGYVRGQAQVWLGLAEIAYQAGDYQSAIQIERKRYIAEQSITNEDGMSAAMLDIGVLAIADNALDLAEAHLHVAEQLHSKPYLPGIYIWLCYLMALQGHQSEFNSYWLQLTKLKDENESLQPRLSLITIACAAAMLRATGDIEHSAQLCGFVEQHRLQTSFLWEASPENDPWFRFVTEPLHNILAPAELEATWAAGRALTWQQAVDEALAYIQEAQEPV